MDSLALKPVGQLTEYEAAAELSRIADEWARLARQLEMADRHEISVDGEVIRRRSAEIEARFPNLLREDSPSLWEIEADFAAPSDLPSVVDVSSSEILTPGGVFPVDSDVTFPERRVIRPRRWSPVDAVTIENFKAIDKAKVTLGVVTILVGPNGSGKSSVLQAIHWAARCASYIQPKNGKEMISFERIDYIPSHEPLKTAFRGELKSDTKTRPTRISFQHEAAAEETLGPIAVVKLWAARNNGGISAHIEGGGAVSPYKQRNSFVTAYIPGLAGLAERESILAQPTLRRQAASGDAGGVLRNILLGLSSTRIGEVPEAGPARLERLNSLLQEVHPSVSLKVSFDEREDVNISAGYTDAGLGSGYRSLETSATGVLQVIQIFAYLIFFRPKILLIDEPDAHLHPDKQERLIEALERAAPEFDAQIVLTTHSPHIAKAASPKAKLVWMSEGTVKAEDDDTIRQLMGWGGLDKQALFFVEDQDDAPIRALVRQWPDLGRRIAICRCFGVDNLPKDAQLRGLLHGGALGLRALVHRDRDFMTDEEVSLWKKLYKTEGAHLWITRGCDVESYFCDAEYLSALYGVTPDEAEEWRQAAAATVKNAQKTYLDKRRVFPRVLWPDGGSPDSTKLWEASGQTPLTVVGKELWSALKPVIKAAGHNDRLLHAFTIPAGLEVAPDLAIMLRTVTA